jgi:hypothetical protein
MAQEVQRHAFWWSKQTAKGVENTTPQYRGFLVGGDIALNRDVGSVNVSDGSKYGVVQRFLNTMQGTGSPAFEASPSALGSLLWLLHGAETFTAGTNNVWTLAGSPASGATSLVIDDGDKLMTTASIANTAAASAIATAVNTAMTTAGYSGTPVVAAGGPLNTTPVTLTFSGTGAAAKPFYLTKTADTTSPAVTLTNTTPGVRNQHRFVPSSTAGFWATFVRSIGTSTVQRHSFIDTLLGGMTLECSQAQKDMRITLPALCLNPFKVVASDPAATLPTGVDSRPFLFTEGTGTYTLGTGVSTTAVSGTQAVTFTTSEDRSPAYGDDVVPYDFSVGTPTIALSTTLIFDGVGLARWNELIYGTASPATGATPQRGLPSAGSYSYDIKQKSGTGNVTGNEVKVTVPSINWDVPESPAPDPGGGLAAVTLGGALAPPGGAVQPYTIDVYNSDAAYT